MKQLLFSFILIFSTLLYSCQNYKEKKINFSIPSPEEQEISSPHETINSIRWNDIPPMTKTPTIPVYGKISLTFMYNNPLYTLRTEGIGADFQETDSFKYLLYQSLLDYYPLRDTFTPVLARRWQYTPNQDGPIYFEIDPYATWGDGTSVLARDVVATFNFLKSDDLGQQEKSDFFKSLEVRELNKKIVEIRTNNTDISSFYRIISQPIFQADQLALNTPKNYIANFNDTPLIGSGPYFLDLKRSSKEKDLYFIHKKKYWGKNNPYLKNIYNFQEVIYKNIPEERTKEWMFKEGELDIFLVGDAKKWLEYWISEEQDLLKRGIWQKKKVINNSPKGVLGLAFNLRKEPLSNILVRQALAHLWDRSNILENVFYGEYNATNSFFPRSIYTNPNNLQYDFNPEKSLSLLKKAGYYPTSDGLLKNEKGETLDIEVLVTDRNAPYFLEFTQEAKKIGINLKLITLPNNALQLRLINHDFDMAYTGFNGVLFPLPDLQFHSSIADNINSLNIWGLNNPKIDNLLQNFNKKNPQEQTKIIQELDYLLSEEIIFLYSWHAPYTNRFIYWNKFNQPLGILGESGQIYDAVKYWWIDLDLENKIDNAENNNLYLPLGKEVENYYQINY